jgi:hypothetical protein
MHYRPRIGHKFVRDINAVISLVSALRGQKGDSWT